MQEVIEAARSLYADELRPFGRILLKRIRERIAAASAAAGGDGDVEAVPLIDPRHLRKMCESCTLFRVEPAEGREYSVTLIGANGVFVDPCSPLDPYPASLWKDAGDYFSTGAGRSECLPSGRYACAQLLVAQGASFLRGRSLGEACHIVQLAISQKKILGYAHGQLVPYSKSEECAKEACALRQQPSGPAVEADVPFATWEDLRVGLIEVLRTSANPAPGMVTLSNVKRLFRANLNLELCETVLGHSRVWELLQDPRLHDICSVQGLGNGQAVVALAPSLLHLCFSSGFGHMMPGYMGQVMPPPMPMAPAPSPLSTCASNRMPLAWAPPPAPGPVAGARVPLSTVPVTTSTRALAPAPAMTGMLPPPLLKPPPSTSQASNFSSEDPSAGSAQLPPLRWDSFGEDGLCFLPATAEEEAARKSNASDTDCTPSVAGDDADSSSSASGGHYLGMPELESSAVPPQLRWDSEEGEGEDFNGYCVKNTFVDVSPRSPQRQRRSRSVPKDANLSPTRASRESMPFRL